MTLGKGKAALAAVAMLVVVGSPLTAPAAAQSGVAVSCAYLQAGPAGPAGNQLQVMQSAVGRVAIATAGGTITVVDVGSPGQAAAVACTGGETPTTTNLDSIAISLTGDGSQPNALRIDLSGGPLGPGASAEPDGDSEIELTAATSGITDLEVAGGSGADRLEFAGVKRSFSALADLNARPGVRDPDLLVGDAGSLEARGGPGDDLLRIRGEAPFDNAELFGQEGDDSIAANGADTSGGPGDDLITGGWFNEWLKGGAGSDRIVSRRGDDHLNPGPGRDVVISDGGSDRIKSRDRSRDRLKCGNGADFARADKQDRAAGCEDVARSS